MKDAVLERLKALRRQLAATDYETSLWRQRTMADSKRKRIQSTRRNISQPDDWWAAFEREANKRGENLSEWLGNCARVCMTMTDRKKLSDRQPANRPKKDQA